DIIRYCFGELFFIFNYTNIEAYTIQLTRDAELDLDLNVEGKFVDILASSLKKREKGKPMRLLYDSEMPQDMLNYLMKKMKLNQDAFIAGNRYHNFKDFIKFPEVGGKELEFPKLPPLPVPGFNLHRSIFSQMKKQDYLVSLPYQSYDYIIHFLREPAIDPKVVSIAISLYRLAEHSNIINALMNAARNGKVVQCFVELDVSLDQQGIIDWSHKLSARGAKVYFGLEDYTVSDAMWLVGRRERKKIR